MKNIKKFLEKVFGGLEMSWPRVIIFAIIMGIWTALMAMLAPDGSSFHDIAVTIEWWVLPAMVIIVNSKKPLEAALKTFVFFLISQPLVYLIQVPFSDMGWGLFRYYPYWFKITLLTFPGAFLGWFVKRDKWYSGVILSVMTVLLGLVGVSCISRCLETPPNHLLTAIYCFTMIPIFIFCILKEKMPRIICAAITAVAIVVYTIMGMGGSMYEALDTTIIEEEGITFVGEPSVTSWTGEGAKGSAEIYKAPANYVVKVSGKSKGVYYFEISDDENTYSFKYYFDEESQSIVIERQD